MLDVVGELHAEHPGGALRAAALAHHHPAREQRKQQEDHRHGVRVRGDVRDVRVRGGCRHRQVYSHGDGDVRPSPRAMMNDDTPGCAVCSRASTCDPV